jgi:hypothetical protein
VEIGDHLSAASWIPPPLRWIFSLAFGRFRRAILAAYP